MDDGGTGGGGVEKVGGSVMADLDDILQGLQDMNSDLSAAIKEMNESLDKVISLLEDIKQNTDPLNPLNSD